MIKSPLRYPGGKSRAVKFIAPLIPDFKEYREPFIGGGSVYFHVRQKYPRRSYWINDLYYELFQFWAQSKIDVEKVVGQVIEWQQTHTNGKVLHRFLLDNINDFSALETAGAFFILNRITFSGTSESGGFSNHAFEERFTPSSIERLRKVEQVLKNTKITNLDYQQVVEAKGDHVFIFLDPPYYSATKSALYGKNGNLHKTFEHERLAKVLKNTSHKWLMTYDNSDYIQELYSFAHISTRELSYGMRNIKDVPRQKEQEIFISNYMED